MVRNRNHDQGNDPAVTASTRNLYLLLGVSQTASSAEIRAAYVRLMKQYHPDSAGTPGYTGQKGDLVPALNDCYAILKDPVKRAAYDAQLHPEPPLRAAVRPRPVHQHRPMPVAPRAADARQSWKTLLLGLGGLVGVVGLSWLAASWRPASLSGSRAGQAQSVQRTASLPLESSAEIARLDPVARAQVQLAATLSPEDAVAASKQCFKAAKLEKGPAASELCVIFDDAVQYLADGSDADSLPPYFAPEAMLARHSEAMAELGDASRDRIDALRQATFTELLDEMHAPPVASASNGPVPALPAGSNPGSGSRDASAAGLPANPDLEQIAPGN